MAEVLRPESGDFWPVDRIVLSYYVFTSFLILGWWTKLAAAPLLMAWHVLAIFLVVYEVKRPNATSWFFRNWYALPYTAWCYKEMALLIPVVRHSDADQWLSDLDFRIWHAHPTIWLERIQTPLLTEFLQLMYTLFIPAVLLVPFLLWKKRRYAEFQYCAFLIALGYLVSYAGYILVPARGPRFLLANLQHTRLEGLWLFHGMQATLDRLESAHYDCFPSGHTELTIIAWWASRMVSNQVFRTYFAYTPFLIFATVYLRYHYTVDVMAGALVAFVLIVAAPAMYRNLSKGDRAIGRN